MNSELQESTTHPGWIARKFGALLTRGDLMEIFANSQSTVTRMAKLPGFPTKRLLGQRSPRWRADEIEAWIERQREVAA